MFALINIIHSHYHHVQIHTANTRTPWLCGISCLYRASIKRDKNDGNALLRQVDVLSFQRERKRSLLNRMTNNWQDKPQMQMQPTDRHNVLLLSSSLHKNLIYTLHSPCASPLIFVRVYVCVCLLIVSWQTSIIMQQREMMLCPHYRGPILLFLCFHYFSPLLFTLVLSPSDWVSIL